jgi:hypothetical protein
MINNVNVIFKGLCFFNIIYLVSDGSGLGPILLNPRSSQAGYTPELLAGGDVFGRRADGSGEGSHRCPTQTPLSPHLQNT